MIDANDNQTQDIFLEAQKRGRGRPATGKALTSAERQAAYRARKHRGPDGGEVTVNHWVTLTNKCALERLARHYRCSESDMLNKLISQAEKSVTDRFEYNDEQWNEYFIIRDL